MSYYCADCRDFPGEKGEEPDWDDEANIVKDLVLLGIVGIQDPVRPEVMPLIPDGPHLWTMYIISWSQFNVPTLEQDALYHECCCKVVNIML